MAATKRNSAESVPNDSKKLRDCTGTVERVSASESPIFTGIKAFVLPVGMGSGRLGLFKSQIVKHGGEIVDNFDAKLVNLAVVDDSVTPTRAKMLLVESGFEASASSSELPHCECVKVSWLSQCLKTNRLLETEEYRLAGVFQNRPHVMTSSPKKSSTISLSETKGCDVAPGTSTQPNAYDAFTQLNDKPKSTVNKSFSINTSKFICSSSSEHKNQNFNEHITEKLQALAETYKNTKDQWRALGYEKAISVLKNYGKSITSREEARGLPGIGERLADKIWEIVESGRLRKMEEVCSEETVKALNLFTNIWGVGPTTAQQFVQQGFRTLEDLRERGNVNRQQKIGLQHYDDILDRMPREEATKIQMTVREAALSLVPGLEVVACGSYRRGKATCGDVDVLVTHPDGSSHILLLPRILEVLRQSGFLTDDLVAHEENGNQHKYLGVCKLPGEETKHRRLDIIVVPYSEYACSLLYFTGSAHFNRSMRLLARKMGMALSEHSLRADVTRRGTEKITEGRILPTPTEESVFAHLGLTYRPPAERDH